MKMLTILMFLLAGCGSMDDAATDDTLAEVAAVRTQHWAPTGNDTPNGCSPVFADLPAATADCTSVPAERDGCSVGCFGAPGRIRVAVGCRGCSAEYAVTFSQ